MLFLYLIELIFNVYVIVNLDFDVKEILFGEKWKDIIEVNIDLESKFVFLVNKSV